MTDQVVFEKTVSGKHYSLTQSQVLALENVLPKILHAGISQIANTARNNLAPEEKDAAEAAMLDKIVADEPWHQGGGNRVDAETRLYREHLAAWAESFAKLKRSDAEKMARKEPDSLAETIAKAILRSKGEKASKDRVSEAASNLQARIQRDVSSVLQAASDI